MNTRVPWLLARPTRGVAKSLISRADRNPRAPAAGMWRRLAGALARALGCQGCIDRQERAKARAQSGKNWDSAIRGGYQPAGGGERPAAPTTGSGVAPPGAMY